jgi:hypothetical protein
LPRPSGASGSTDNSPETCAPLRSSRPVTTNASVGASTTDLGYSTISDLNVAYEVPGDDRNGADIRSEQLRARGQRVDDLSKRDADAGTARYRAAQPDADILSMRPDVLDEVLEGLTHGPEDRNCMSTAFSVTLNKGF